MVGSSTRDHGSMELEMSHKMKQNKLPKLH